MGERALLGDLVGVVVQEHLDKGAPFRWQRGLGPPAERLENKGARCVFPLFLFPFFL